MFDKDISGIKVEIIRGDITTQDDVEAVVNAANAQLRPGGGVAGAIHRQAGPGLDKECRPLAPINPGEAVITGGHDLPNEYIIHCLGPVYGRGKPESDILARCYENSLELGDQKGIKSIAFPAISTGAFGYPTKEAAEIALTTIKNISSNLDGIKLIRFVLFSQNDYQIHKELGNKILVN